jgi:integrase
MNHHSARHATVSGAVHLTCYSLRHSFTTWHYAHLKDILKLMSLGGEAKADMVRRYSKDAPDDLPDRLLAHGWDFRSTSGRS